MLPAWEPVVLNPTPPCNNPCWHGDLGSNPQLQASKVPDREALDLFITRSEELRRTELGATVLTSSEPVLDAFL